MVGGREVVVPRESFGEGGEVGRRVRIWDEEPSCRVGKTY